MWLENVTSKPWVSLTFQKKKKKNQTFEGEILLVGLEYEAWKCTGSGPGNQIKSWKVGKKKKFL